MIYNEKSKLMLKYQKAKVKLAEYKVPKKDYPNFKYNSNDLSFSTMYILSKYSESVIENDEYSRLEIEQYLISAAQYYDAAVNSKDRDEYGFDFLLSGAAAYFLIDDFGSSKVLINKIKNIDEFWIESSQLLLLNFLNYILSNKKMYFIKENNTYSKLNNAIINFFNNGNNKEDLVESLHQFRFEVYQENYPDNIFYVDILYAIILRAIDKSSWNLLPKYTGLAVLDWYEYLQKSTSIKMFWPAQQLIGNKGILLGENAIVQLPTGVGKTKSIELIIRSAFLTGRAKNAIIVAPLRALCNEITNDMLHAFNNEAEINQFSDVLQEDINILFEFVTKNQIIICTPEKLNYVIHHQPDFLVNLDLFIFDEGHMFDDGSRGTTYELLITYIKECLTEKQQMVLLSAVLPNSEEIKNWLFSENGVLAKDERIKSTPKSVGFASSKKDIYFYTDDSTNYDYFIPNVLQPQKLNLKPRERKDKYFPKLNDANDIALFNAFKLCKSGGVAIYVAQTKSVNTIFKRIIELYDREYDLSIIKEDCNDIYLNKINRLFIDYYGTENIFSKVCNLGIVPHYSILPNGIKMAVEYGLKNNHIRFVVCTSTLAQGVNIPIKYLFVTNTYTSSKSMKVRSFQNLIGRTARSGIYTEGSVIITNPKIYDSKLTKENYKWKNCVKMFDSNFLEPCGSSILSLVKDIKISEKITLDAIKIVEYIISHYDDDNCFSLLAETVERAYLSTNPDNSQNNIVEEILGKQKIIEAIENYYCLILGNDSLSIEDTKQEICKKTLAYYLANDSEKVLLEAIFDRIAKKVEMFSKNEIKKYSFSMLGVNFSQKIEQWVLEKNLLDNQLTEDELLESILVFFKQNIKIKKCEEKFDVICQLWLEGKMPQDILSQTSYDISDIDFVCSKYISYDLNFFIGNITDIISTLSSEESSICLTLNSLQKRIKYGVKTKTAVTICEEIFNDRYLASNIANIVQNDDIGSESIIFVLNHFKDEIFNFLSNYPECFTEKLYFTLKD